MELYGKVAVITGAASGIGRATCEAMLNLGIEAIGVVDRSSAIIDMAQTINDEAGRQVLFAYSGDVSSDAFREEVFTDLRTGRGVPEVETYAMPPATTWDQVRSGVAGQLDGWKQVGDCADTGERQVKCSWSEPARLWPRLVRIVFLRPAEPDDANSYVWPDNTFLVVGSARGTNR